MTFPSSDAASSSSSPPPPTHLIIVCCHAIYHGPSGSGSRSGSGSESKALGGTGRASRDEKNWLIEPFQRGETDTYIAHVEAGVRELANDPSNALLVFSGGSTKRDRTDKTEGDGYLDVALEHEFFNLATDTETHTDTNTSTRTNTSTNARIRDRIFVDRYATDSYQNILLSLVQWPLFVQQFKLKSKSNTLSPLTTTPYTKPPPTDLESGLPGPGKASASENTNTSEEEKEDNISWPTKLTIISHEFKRSRFLDLHLPAIQWPVSSSPPPPSRRVEYIGIDPPFDEVRMREIQEGDRIRGFGVWKDDWYASGQLLSAKRVKRGWDPDVFRRDVLGRYGTHNHNRNRNGSRQSTPDEPDEPNEMRSVLEKVVFWDERTSGRRLRSEDVPWST